MADSHHNVYTQWISFLKSNGIKLTGPRYCVVEILTQTDKALTALEIYNRAHSRYPSVGLVSVYRALEKLESLNLIQRVHQKDKCQAYIANPTGHEHLLLCSACGKVSFFAGDDLKSLMRRVARKTGFVVQDHWLQLVGLCEDCQKTGID